MPGEPTFEALLEDALPQMRAYARSLTGNADQANDLVQDVALALLKSRHTFVPGSNFAAWATVSIRNKFVDGRRRARFHGGSIDDLDGDSVLFSRPALQEHAVWCDEVSAAFNRLPGLYRDLITRLVGGETYEDLARAYRCPVGTIRSRIARGRATLLYLLGDGPRPRIKLEEDMAMPDNRDWTSIHKLDDMIDTTKARAAETRGLLSAIEHDLALLQRVRALLSAEPAAWDLVPAGELSDEIKDGADPRPIDPPPRPAMRQAEPEFRSRVEPDQPPEPKPLPRAEWGQARGRIVAYMEQRGGGVGISEVARALGISKTTVTAVIQGLMDAGQATRHGPQRGPGVSFKLAKAPQTNSENVTPPRGDPDLVMGLPKLPAQNAAPAPLPRAEDLRWDNVRPPAMPKPEPSKDAEAVRLNMALDELLDAGDRGIAPSALREALGLELQKFDALMARLLDKNIVSKVPRDDGSGKTYVLRVTGQALREYRATLG